MKRRRFGFGELVTADTASPGTLDDKLNLAFDDVEESANERVLDHHPYGVITGLEVVPNSPANMTIKVNAGAADDQSGQRIKVPSQQSIDPLVDYQENAIALPTLGNEKYVSIFVRFERLNQDPQQDDNSVAYYESELESFQIRVRAGSEAPTNTATKPSLQGAEILLADIKLTPGMTTIQTSDIQLTSRRQDAWALSPSTATPKTIRYGNVKAVVTDLLSWLNDLLNGTLTLSTAGVTHTNGSEKFAGTVSPPSDGDLQTWLRALVTMLGKTTSTVGADLIGNSSLGNWADSTAAGIANGIGVQLRAVVAALAATTGTAKIGGASVSQSPTSLTAADLATQIAALLTAINARARKAVAETITAKYTFDIGGGGGSGIETASDTSTDLGGELNLGADLNFTTTNATPAIQQAAQASTGANDGVDLTIAAQPGQAQTGGSDNNTGGDFVRSPGAPGTGGSGAAGQYGDDVLLFNDREYRRYGEVSALAASSSTTLRKVTIPTGAVATIEVRCQNKNSNGTGGSHVIVGTFRNISGTTSQQGSTSAPHTGSNNTGAAVAFNPSGADVEVNVTAGSAGASTTSFNAFITVNEFTP